MRATTRVLATGEEMLSSLLQRSARLGDTKVASQFEAILQKPRVSELDRLLMGREFKPAYVGGKPVTEVLGTGSRQALVLGARSGEAEFARLMARELLKYEANLALGSNPYLKAFEVGSDYLKTLAGGAGAWPLGGASRTVDGLTYVSGNGAIWYTAPGPISWPYGSLPGNEPNVPPLPEVVFPGLPQIQYYYGAYIGPGTFGGWYYGPTLAVPDWDASRPPVVHLQAVPSASAGAESGQERKTKVWSRYHWHSDEHLMRFRPSRRHAWHKGHGKKPPPPDHWIRGRPPGRSVEGKYRLSPKRYKSLWIIANLLGDAAEFVDALVGASSGTVTVLRANKASLEHWGYDGEEYGQRWGPGHRRYFTENKYLGWKYKPWVSGGPIYQKARWFVDGGWKNFDVDKFATLALWNVVEDAALGMSSQWITANLTPPGRGFGITIGPAI